MIREESQFPADFALRQKGLRNESRLVAPRTGSGDLPKPERGTYQTFMVHKVDPFKGLITRPRVRYTLGDQRQVSISNTPEPLDPDVKPDIRDESIPYTPLKGVKEVPLIPLPLTAEQIQADEPQIYPYEDGFTFDDGAGPRFFHG